MLDPQKIKDRIFEIAARHGYGHANGPDPDRLVEFSIEAICEAVNAELRKGAIPLGRGRE